MQIDATAQALVADEATPLDIEPETTTESEDDVLSAAFDRISADEEPEEPTEAVAEEKAEEPAEDDTPPPDIPFEIKQNWANIPSEARDAFIRTQRDMAQKLSEQGRVQQGLAPIQDTLVQAAKDNPSLAAMTPKQIADEMLSLAKISQSFNENPVRAKLGLIDQHNMRPQLQAALGGNPQQQQSSQYVAGLQNEIRQLKMQLDPSNLRSQFDNWMGEATVTSSIQEFAAQAEHWPAVEEHLVTTIPVARAKLGEGASETDVLTAAYELAVSTFVPEAKAKGQAAVEAAIVPDPARAKAAVKAKSVNVSGSTTGKTRELSEDEKLAQVYDRAQQK